MIVRSTGVQTQDYSHWNGSITYKSQLKKNVSKLARHISATNINNLNIDAEHFNSLRPQCFA